MATPPTKQTPKFMRVVCADTFAFLCACVTLIAPLLTWLVKAPWMGMARMLLWFVAFLAAVSLTMRYLYFLWVFNQGDYADGYINVIDRALRQPLVKVFYTYSLDGKDRYSNVVTYDTPLTRTWQPYTYVQVVTPPLSPNRAFMVKLFAPEWHAQQEESSPEEHVLHPQFFAALCGDVISVLALLAAFAVFVLVCGAFFVGVRSVFQPLAVFLAYGAAVGVVLFRYLRVMRIFEQGTFTDASIFCKRVYQHYPLVEVAYTYDIDEQTYQGMLVACVNDTIKDWNVGMTIRVITALDDPSESFVVDALTL